MIKINNLEKKLSSEFVLKIDELNIEDGERVVVIGPNGSGKSTLLRLIAGIIKPDSGTVEVSADRKKTGYEPQNPYAFRTTVEKNIRIGLHKRSDIEKILSACRLSDLRNKPSQKISGGEKQRMCFARMLAGNYSLLILDEPLSAADIETSSSLENLLVAECKKNGTTLLMATHLPAQALNIATKILIISDGCVSEYSDVSDLKNPKSEFGRKFINQWRIG